MAESAHSPVRPIAWPRWTHFVLVWLAFGCAVSFLHLNAVGLVDTPGQQPISWAQSLTAAFGNTLGPWAGYVVRLVDFPNAGLRSVTLLPALALTIFAIALVAVGLRNRRTGARRIALVLFATAMPVWYGYGFVLITDGLL